VILTNRILIEEEEIIDFIIDGISIENLRDYAHITNYMSKAALLKAFGESKRKDS